MVSESRRNRSFTSWRKLEGFSKGSVKSKAMSTQNIFENLWTDYITLNPEAKRVHDLVLAEEKRAGRNISRLENDHVAFRTYKHPRIGLPTFVKIFEKHGYSVKGEYFFKEKKLYAQHMESNNPDQPRIFISELLIENFDDLVAETTEKAANAVPDGLLTQDQLLWHGRPWSASFATYQELMKQSEYAAWVYAFGFRTNHFTVSLNHLKAFSDLATLNSFLKNNGVELNTSGGEIKGSKAVFLEQSSTLAEKVDVKFSDRTEKIPSCYYEFAQRYNDPSGKLYNGFVEGSADKIFESTYLQKSK